LNENSVWVHRSLGPGLLESVYEAALGWERESRGIAVIYQLGIPVVYEGVHIHTGFFADLVIDNPCMLEEPLGRLTIAFCTSTPPTRTDAGHTQLRGTRPACPPEV
jgi:hypothetical protein